MADHLFTDLVFCCPIPFQWQNKNGGDNLWATSVTFFTTKDLHKFPYQYPTQSKEIQMTNANSPRSHCVVVIIWIQPFTSFPSSAASAFCFPLVASCSLGSLDRISQTCRHLACWHLLPSDSSHQTGAHETSWKKTLILTYGKYVEQIASTFS